MILFENKKTKTLLEKKITFKVVRRFMESQAIILTAYEKANSFYLYGRLKNEIYADYADQSFVYVMDHLDEFTFSQMLENSYKHLSYQLSTQSFETIIEGMLLHPKTCESTKRIISLYDDLGMYNHENFQRIDFYPKRLYYHNLFVQRNKPDFVLDINDSSSTASIDDSPVQNSYLSITNADDFKTNAHTESALFNNGNNNQVILLTMVAFTIIIVGSWLINKYFPDKEKTVEEFADLKENYSVYETWNLGYNYVILLVSFMIPSIVSLLYSYRYYYIYKIKRLLKR